MSNLRLSYLQKVWGGGEYLYRPSPHPKKWGGGGYIPPSPSPGIYASANVSIHQILLNTEFSARGGGGYFHYWRWWGRAAGQGMIFTVINIDTGYLNRPNWLLAGYSVYHRVASRASQPGSQPTMFMTGPRSRHQRRCVRDVTDFEFFIS